MSIHIADRFKSYMITLPATNLIASYFGATFVFNKNLFVGVEPATTADTLTIIPYPGAPPSRENEKYESSVQIRLKCSSREKALNVQQAVINSFNNNTKVCTGRVSANQSAPIILELLDNGKYIVTVSNYNIKHVKFV